MRVYLIELQWSLKDSLYSSESIYIILLQEKPEIEKLQLHPYGAYEPDCGKPEETFTAG